MLLPSVVLPPEQRLTVFIPPVTGAGAVDVIVIGFEGVHVLQFNAVSIAKVDIEIALHGLNASIDSHSSRSFIK